MKRTASHGLHPTSNSFQRDVLESPTPVIVDFWAPWCRPCLALKPEMERLAADLAGKASVAFINVDEQPELADRFNITGIPAVMVFKGGRAVDAWAGYAPRTAILTRLQQHLGR